MNNDFESGMWDREYPSEDEFLEQQQYETQDVYEEEEDSNMYDDDEFYEDFIGEYSEEREEREEREESLMNQAHVRLEQGRLYNLLIKHNLFDGVDADFVAISNVEKEIKGFILERLEILLGMKSERKTEIQQIIQEPQFNDAEVEALKMVASKVTRGASETAPTSSPKQTQVKSELNSITSKPKQTGLNSLGKNSHKTRPVPATAVKKQVSKPLRKSSEQKPVRKLKKEMVEVSTENMNTDEIAKRDINYIENLKKSKSIEEANKIVAERHNRPRPKTVINSDVVNSYYTNRVATGESTLSDFGKIMRLAALAEANKKG